MDCDDVRKLVIETLQAFQELSGEPSIEIDEDTSVYQELPNFDSIRAVEVAVVVSEELGCEAQAVLDLFLPDHVGEEVKVGVLIEHLCTDIHSTITEEVSI